MQTVKLSEWLNDRRSTRILLMEADCLEHESNPVLTSLTELANRFEWKCLPIYSDYNNRYMNGPHDEQSWRVVCAHADGCLVNNYSNKLSMEFYLLLATLWQKNVPVIIYGQPLAEFIPYGRLAYIDSLTDLEDILTIYKYSRSMPDYKLRIDHAIRDYKI